MDVLPMHSRGGWSHRRNCHRHPPYDNLSLDVLLDGGRKCRLVEQRWVGKVGDGADVSTEFLFPSSTVVNRTGSLGEAFDVGSHRSKVHSEGGHHLAFAVVQRAGDAPSLV